MAYAQVGGADAEVEAASPIAVEYTVRALLPQAEAEVAVGSRWRRCVGIRIHLRGAVGAVCWSGSC